MKIVTRETKKGCVLFLIFLLRAQQKYERGLMK